MGRYNNRRTQQQAEALRNTPARARFSKPPPNQQQRRRGGRGGRGDNNNNDNSNEGRGGRGRGGRGNGNGRGVSAGRTAVVSKMTQRLQQQQQQPATQNSNHHPNHTTSTTADPLRGIDVSKLDEINISEEAMEAISDILAQLKVLHRKEQDKIGDDNDVEDNQDDAKDATNPSSFVGDRSSTSSGGGKRRPRPIENTANKQDSSEYEGNFADGGYVEYEHDWDDSKQAYVSHDNNRDAIDDGQTEANGRDATETMLDTVQQDQEEGQEENEDEFSSFRTDPVFLHLTRKLSFAPSVAATACQAITTWNIRAKQKDNDNNNNKNSNDPAASNKDRERLTLAMDYLCLHLPEEQLEAGFRTQQTPAVKDNYNDLETTANNNSNKKQYKYKAIPHASISLAVNLTEDWQWQQDEHLRKRAVPFVKLGFHFQDALQACERQHQQEQQPKKNQQPWSSSNNSSTNNPNSSSNTVNQALQDWSILQTLLEQLEEEQQITGAHSSQDSKANDKDPDMLQNSRMEQEQEMEALSAIYGEDNVQTFQSDTNPPLNCVKINLPRDLLLVDLQPTVQEDNETCRLYILMRPGYPLVETPLFLFYHAKLAAALLRRINCALVQHAAIIPIEGQPFVFDIVSFLQENLDTLYQQYEEEQALIRDGTLDAEPNDGKEGEWLQEEDENDEDAPLGRRQRARLKGAQKAYNYAEKMEQKEKERIEKRERRIEMAQHQQANIRQTLAERHVLERQEAYEREQLELASRNALSKALNEGMSVEEARIMAARAEGEVATEHGYEHLLSPEVKAMISQDKKTAVESDEGRENNANDGNPGDSLDYENKQENGESGAEATPTTKAFMERLRSMYSSAQKRGPYDLRKPMATYPENLDGEKGRDGDEDCNREPITPSTLPCPIPAKTGDFTRLMDDVIKLQNEQPWLISDDARVPERAVEGDVGKSDSTVQDVVKFSGRDVALSKKIRSFRDRMWASEQYANQMQKQRERLPAFERKDEISSTIRNSQVVVISGATGSGKTTQVPQFVLDEMISSNRGAQANILVTQPRRISAIGVAERMSAERCEKCGQTVGYSIKLEKKMSKHTRLLLCTTGVLLRRLMGDPDLASVSHVFVDEVHQRDVQTDFMLIILRDLLRRRRNLKVVLMSATLNAKAFSDYFGGCPIVSIPGRTHPVQELRLEDILQETGHEIDEDSDYAFKKKKDSKLQSDSDAGPERLSKTALKRLYYPKYNSKVIHSLSIVDESLINYELVADLLEHICMNREESGAILVFMPGMMEITKMIEQARTKDTLQSTSSVLILPLHSSLTSSEQLAVFQVPPKGVRKIVVGTNIMETSVTIEDAVFVVDCGRAKENTRDELNGVPALVEDWVSRASANQRRGRAGRVRPGIAYHLFSSHTHDNELKEYEDPEIQRVGLEDLILQILLLDLGPVIEFLSSAISRPGAFQVRNSLKLLEELGAIECTWINEQAALNTTEQSEQRDCSSLEVDVELTPLGFHLASLPVNPRVGKMIIYGAMFGCVEAAVTIASAMSSKSPFVAKFDQRELADKSKRDLAILGSDHLAILNAFTQWKSSMLRGHTREATSFLKRNCLSRFTLNQMHDLRKQYINLLMDIGFLPHSYDLNKQDKVKLQGQLEDLSMISAVLSAGLYPNIAVAPKGLLSPGKLPAGESPFHSVKGEVHLHPSTVMFESTQLSGRYCCYHDIIKTSKLYVRDLSVINPMSLLLFGGALQVFPKQQVVTVDKFRFRVARKPATLIKYFRAQMETILLNRIISPEDDKQREKETEAMMKCIRFLLTSTSNGTEEKARNASNRKVDSENPRQRRHLPRDGRGGGRGGGRGKRHRNDK